MTRALEDLRNLGPVTARRLAAVGIADEAALRGLGPVAAYARLRHAYPRETGLNALWAIAGALADLPWNRLPDDLKARLRAEVAGRPRRG
jgi:DNA transformation protein